MMIAQRSGRNALKLPEAVLKHSGEAKYFAVSCEAGRIVLTPLLDGEQASVGLRHLVEQRVSEAELAAAMRWAERL